MGAEICALGVPVGQGTAAEPEAVVGARPGGEGRAGFWAESKVPRNTAERALSRKLGARGCGRSELRLWLRREFYCCVSRAKAGLWAGSSGRWCVNESAVLRTPSSWPPHHLACYLARPAVRIGISLRWVSPWLGLLHCRYFVKGS